MQRDIPSHIAHQLVRLAQAGLTQQPDADVGPFVKIPISGARIAAYRTIVSGAKHIRYEIVFRDGDYRTDLGFGAAMRMIDDITDGVAVQDLPDPSVVEGLAGDRLTLAESMMLGLDDGTTSAAFAEQLDFTKYVKLLDEEHAEHVIREKHVRGERPMLEHMRRHSDRHQGGRIKHGRR